MYTDSHLLELTFAEVLKRSNGIRNLIKILNDCNLTIKCILKLSIVLLDFKLCCQWSKMTKRFRLLVEKNPHDTSKVHRFFNFI